MEFIAIIAFVVVICLFLCIAGFLVWACIKIKKITIELKKPIEERKKILEIIGETEEI